MKKIKGTKDYYGIEAKKLSIVINELNDIASIYSYDKIFAPTLEETSLFSRAVGNETDVVNKEMYSFEDKKGRSISLRPEGTAQAVRVALENKLLDNNSAPNLFYLESMFRYERPQKGRQREFFQFGVENFGKTDAYNDIEVLILASDILRRFNIEKYELQINTIGNSDDRKRYNEALKSFINEKIESFSDYAKEKVASKNVLRVLDSKIEEDQELLKDAPKINDYINDESKARYETIKEILRNKGINYIENNSLVRGLDYYNDLVFEFVSTDEEALGTKSTIIAGGRYDSLVNKIDETKNIPAIGFAIGIERLMLASQKYLEATAIEYLDYYIATAYPEEDKKDVAIEISIKLRELGYRVLVDYEDKKLAKKLEKADKLNSTFAIIVGNEISEGKVTIKELGTQESETKKIEEV